MVERLLSPRSVAKIKAMISRWPVREPAPEGPRKRPRPPGYENAREDEVRPNIRRIVREACNAKRWPLYFHGAVGRGKTCAAACVYGSWDPEDGKALAKWFRADDLLLRVSQGRGSGQMRLEHTGQAGERTARTLSYDEWQNEIKHKTTAVFLDDLGTRSATEGMYQSLFDLLEWRKGKPLVITSNKSPAELAAIYDDRIVDRIAGAGTVVEFTEEQSRRWD